MSVKICYKDGNIKDFCDKSPLIEQLKDVDHVYITVTEDYGKSAEMFLKSISKVSPFEPLPPVDLRVEKGNTIIGAKLSKEAKELNKSLALYWVVSEIVNFQKRLDTKLSDMVKTIKSW